MSNARDSRSGSPEILIVGLAQTGDRGAFEELVRRRQSWIRNLMRRFSGDPVLADDLAQQVFLQAWKTIAQLKKPGSFGAWLKKLAVSVWLQHIRKNDPLRQAASDDEPAMTQEPPTGMALDLDGALSSLPGDMRLCVVLSYHEGMAHAEIAEMTGLPLGTVKSHIRRGTERLRRLLAAYRPAGQSEEKQ